MFVFEKSNGYNFKMQLLCYMIFLTYVSYKLRYNYSFACVHIQFICYFKTFLYLKWNYICNAIAGPVIKRGRVGI
jgi:hypothetical protein